MEGRGYYRYSFHWCADVVPPRLQYYRQHQQDALRYTWDGPIAGTDGSVDVKTESMGAGYVVGVDPVPLMTLSIRVGGPLATTRAEAASMLRLVRDIRQTNTNRINLLVFVDCLVVLDILRKWGRCDYHPRPKDVVHFDVIWQLLVELRKWSGQIRLVKIKSHSGCLLYERADEEAERGRTAEGSELCPGPPKYGALWLRVTPSTRTLAEACGQRLPRDSAPNVSIIKKVVSVHTLRAVRKRNTVFVRNLLHRPDGATVAGIIKRCGSAEYRVWLRCMLGIYPTQTYLHRVGLATSSCSPHCAAAVPESLAHFACVCPQYREARTSAHNQVRRVITSFLSPLVGPKWAVHEEVPMNQTGLVLRPVSAQRVCAALDRSFDPCDGLDAVRDLGRWQPDWVFVSVEHKRIALVDLCRPADDHTHQLVAAGARKQKRYSPLVEALADYSNQGWVVHVFPWIVGIRGMIIPQHILALMEFVAIPKKYWHKAVERTVLASVRALYFLHRVRFGGPLGEQRSKQTPCSQDSSDGENDDMADLESQITRKRSTRTTQAGVRPELSSEIELTGPPKKRMRHLHAVLQRQQRASMLAAHERAPSQTTRRASSTHGPRRFKRHNIKQRASNKDKCAGSGVNDQVPAKSARTHDGTSEDSELDRTTECLPLAKRKRKLSDCAGGIFDTDDPVGAHPKQPRYSSGDQLDTLWNRWRQLADRRQRKT